jgi:hypothetical protein
MSNQVLSKLGVFALIVINLGAYYVFWPNAGSQGPGPENVEKPGRSAALAANASAAQPGDAWKPSMPSADPQLPDPAKKPDPLLTLPTQEAKQSKAPTLPHPVADSSKVPALPTIPEPAGGLQPVGLVEPASPAQPPAPPPADPTKEQLKRLVETFKKDSTAKPVAVAQGDPPAPVAPVVQTPTEPARPVQTESSPWSLQWELADGHAVLTARLYKRLEFRIQCDRVKMDSPDGAVLAIGKVSFSGPGVKGTCKQLTIGLAGDTIVLEGQGQLQVQQGNPSDLAIPTVELSGERLSVRLQQLTGGVGAAQAFPGAPTTPTPGVGNAVPTPFTVAPLGLEKKGP